MIQQALSKLRKERFYVVMALFVSVVLGVVLSFLVSGYYTSIARIIPPQQVQSSLTGLMGQLGTLGFTGLAGLRNPSDVHIQLLRSDTVARAMAKRFDLYEHYGAEKFEDVRHKLEKRSRIRAGRDGVVLIQVTDKNADVAAALANGYSDELYKLVQRLSAEETAQRKQFIEARMLEVRKSLEAKEQEFRALQEKVGMLRVEGQVETTYATMGGLRANIMMREVALRALSSSSTAQNPTYRNIEAEIAGLKSQLEKLEQSPQVLNPKFVIPADRAPQLVMEYVRKLRDLKFEEGMYQMVQKQSELIRMEDTRDFLQFLVVDSARAATKRDFPTQPMVVLITVLLGLVLAVWLVVTDRIWYPSELWRKSEAAGSQ